MKGYFIVQNVCGVGGEEEKVEETIRRMEENKKVLATLLIETKTRYRGDKVDKASSFTII